MVVRYLPQRTRRTRRDDVVVRYLPQRTRRDDVVVRCGGEVFTAEDAEG